MKLYRTPSGLLLYYEDRYFLHTDQDWDELVNQDNLFEKISQQYTSWEELKDGAELLRSDLLPPIGNQEVWASGVTYYRSRDARMEEAKEAGGGSFYDRVYEADRPELFFKATAARTVGHGANVRIREDSTWDVPEPELTLFINSQGNIQGYTIGNDMSSRSIEGENPLYLPQAKSYWGSCAIGPGLYITDQPFSQDAEIHLTIRRGEAVTFRGETQVNQIKRKFTDLVSYLYREMDYPNGCYLMTGTGIIPEGDFTLQSGDEINITIEPIGTLTNTVE
ncbi:fumarylacetoacetate hydrolase family protein [Tunicatimonas pelagia]|uniref:fumarylacetoacetate hydrolase family protein n=1 Tax=Tunicatimonas pelagia TaxID=931531 RepID=UPI00266634C5|nr:fumarylacetoacetate hydrolase family protein [Tunicatimonas pelagia]WKN43337.1 fumarylacetoacetate hydrolase family protein [Tunicatimonas pelagia]